MKIKRNLKLFLSAIVAVASITSLQAQDKPAEEKKPTWESSLTAGATMTRGNSETLTATLIAKTEKKWEKNEFKLGADGTYGKSKDKDTGEETVDKNTGRAYAQYNRLFTERLYGFVLADGMFDDVAMISYQVTVSPGLGYYFIKQPKTTLSVQVGPGYVWKDLRNTPNEGESKTTDYPSLRVGEDFSHEFSDRVKVWEKADWTPSLKNFSESVVNVEVGVSSYLTENKKLALSVIFNDTYNSVPAAGKEFNDMKLTMGLAYAF